MPACPPPAGEEAEARCRQVMGPDARWAGSLHQDPCCELRATQPGGEDCCSIHMALGDRGPSLTFGPRSTCPQMCMHAQRPGLVLGSKLRTNVTPARSTPGNHLVGSGMRATGDSGTKAQPLLAEKMQCHRRRTSEGRQEVGGCGPFCTWARLHRSPQVTRHFHESS